MAWEYEESERSHRVRAVQARINAMHRKHLQRFSKQLKNLEAKAGKVPALTADNENMKERLAKAGAEVDARPEGSLREIDGASEAASPEPSEPEAPPSDPSES